MLRITFGITFCSIHLTWLFKICNVQIINHIILYCWRLIVKELLSCPVYTTLHHIRYYNCSVVINPIWSSSLQPSQKIWRTHRKLLPTINEQKSDACNRELVSPLLSASSSSSSPRSSPRAWPSPPPGTAGHSTTPSYSRYTSAGSPGRGSSSRSSFCCPLGPSLRWLHP